VADGKATGSALARLRSEPRMEAGQLTAARIRSLNGNSCRVRYGDETRMVTLAKGESKRVD